MARTSDDVVRGRLAIADRIAAGGAQEAQLTETRAKVDATASRLDAVGGSGDDLEAWKLKLESQLADLASRVARLEAAATAAKGGTV